MWLDCDREGENIAYEVVRAHFSALTHTDLLRAWNDLQQPDEALAEAVDCRQELDLRIGAALTRFLTLRYQRMYCLPAKLVSYGPCQFPTLGFVVERHLQREAFASEDYWSLGLRCVAPPDGASLRLSWGRGNLFDRFIVEMFRDLCQASMPPHVESVQTQRVTHPKPPPLTTTEMTVKAASRFRIPSKRCMQIAEALYQKGIISYPRTETDRFAATMDLRQLVRLQCDSSAWGAYASRLVNGGSFRAPREGRNDDHAHPPIHPVKCLNRNSFASNDEWRVYDLITRHFLACVSEDAESEDTRVRADLGGETFHASGTVITRRGFLEIYEGLGPGIRETPLPRGLQEGMQLPRATLEMPQGRTQPPALLSEADLIRKMDAHGIGTDATMHEHIQTIQDRLYVDVIRDRTFMPTPLGVALVKGFKGYAQEWLDLSKPHLRANMEADMSLIASRRKRKDDVVRQYTAEMHRVFNVVASDPSKLDDAMTQFFGNASNTSSDTQNGDSRGTRRGVYMIPPQSLLTEVVADSLCVCACSAPMDIRRPAAAPHWQREPLRYLVCRNAQCPVLPLPRNGQFSPHQHTCPQCGYQVLRVLNPETRATYYICPSCFSAPPPVLLGDIESAPQQNQLRCFLCCHPTCTLAGGRTRA